MHAHLGVLADVRAGRGLSAGVGIDLRVEHEHLDVHARSEHSGQRLEADVEHRAVAADAPHRFVLPAHLVPARAHAHGVGGRVLEQRVRPRHEVRVVGIRRRVDRVAAGGRDDAPLDRRTWRRWRRTACAAPSPLAAAGARAGAADVDVRLLLEHHVDQQVVVDVLLVGRADLLEVAMALADVRPSPARSWGSSSAPSSSHTVTHSAQPLHLLGSMMIANRPPLALFLRAVVVFARLGPLLLRTSRDRLRRDRLRVSPPVGSPSTLPRMAVSGHSVTQSMQPVQLSAIYSRNFGRDVAEVAQRGRAGRNDRAGVDRSAGRPFFASARLHSRG